MYVDLQIFKVIYSLAKKAKFICESIKKCGHPRSKILFYFNYKHAKNNFKHANHPEPTNNNQLQ